MALARALVFRPPLLLMDEPLGALDRRLRETLQLEIRRLHRELGITFVYVTHDQDEALTLSDRVAVFNAGRIEQVGSADDLYERPRTRFVAEFLGDSNVFSGIVDGPRAVRLTDGTHLDAGDCGPAREGQPITVVVRPERIRLLDSAPVSGGNALKGKVCDVRYLGAARKIEVDAGGQQPIIVREPSDRPSGVRRGDVVTLGWRADDCVLLTDDPPIADPGPAVEVPTAGARS